MKKFFILILLVVIIGGISALLWLRHEAKFEKQDAENLILSNKPAVMADNKEFFHYNTLNDDLVKFANEAYNESQINDQDSDNPNGKPPFRFFKRVDCEVVGVDKQTEKIIKRAPETVSFHAIVLLKDTRGDLYDFTLTSTVPDKSVVRLQHYGPLTNENPEVVQLPINQRRLRDFPIDFNTNKVLRSNEGRCIYVPYPFPADQTFWLLGNDLHNSPIQGLYRNDRLKNVDELINQILKSVKEESTLE